MVFYLCRRYCFEGNGGFLSAGQVSIRCENMRLKPKEFALLLEFAENEGRVVSAGTCRNGVESPDDGDNRTLEKHIFPSGSAWKAYTISIRSTARGTSLRENCATSLSKGTFEVQSQHG
jgi:hypothetical protein